MAQTFIKFTDFVPDQADLNDSGLIVANNTLPILDGYGPFPSAAAWSSNAITGTPRGVISFYDTSGTVTSFIGTYDKIWKLTGQAFSDVSKSGGYSSATDDYVKFVSWGNDFVFSTNFSDPIQKMQVGTDSTFSDLSSSAPKAKDMSVVNNFLVTINTSESDGNHPNRVRWSPIGNPEGTWGSIDATQTDFQDLQTGDFCVGIVGGEYGTILCNDAIYRMSYASSPVIFQFEEVERNVNILSGGSYTWVGNNIYYVGRDGFFLFNGSKSAPIGNSRVDKYFFDNINKASFYKIQCTANIEENVIIWSFNSSSASLSNTIDKALIYNYVLNKWSTLEPTDSTFLIALRKSGYTLDELDPFGTMETLPYSLDSEEWKGGDYVFATLKADGTLAYFTGSPMTATFETSDQNLNNIGASYITRIRPIRNAGTASVKLSGRQKQSDSVSYSSPATETTLGDMSIRNTGRYQRIHLTMTGTGWTEVQGLVVDHEAAGFR